MPLAVLAAAAAEGGAFPPFDVETFPSQLFWLSVTFTVLLLVMWRIAGPKIGATLAARKARIDGDLATAAKHKEEAEKALTAYAAALDEAKGRAHKLADENRKEINAEVEKSRVEADQQAKQAAQSAEARIAAMRQEAAEHVTKAAQDAAVAIVGRLIGDTVSAEDAAAAVKAVRR